MCYQRSVAKSNGIIERRVARPDETPRDGDLDDVAAGAWRFDDRVIVSGREGDTIASALLAAGEVMTSRSAKYRRPRGPYCLSGDCGTCIVRVDGRPNIRACMTAWRPGMTVERQNTYRPATLDPTGLVDRVFAKGIDHHHLAVRPRIVNQAMQTFARQLTGFGTIPSTDVDVDAAYRHHEVPVLVVGAGSAGRAAAALFEGAGVEHLVVDRLDPTALERPALAPPDGAPLPRRLLGSVGIFAAYELDDVWAGGREQRSDDGRHLVSLHTFRAAHVLLATGARDTMLELPNNDLPGVVAARGLLRQLGCGDARLADPRRVVVVGRGDLAERCATALGTDRLDPDDVVALEGTARVTHVVTHDGRRECDLVALAPTPAPAHELAVMAGATTSFDGAGFAVERDEDGLCAAFNDAKVWVGGDLAGWRGPEAAAADGHRVAERILAHLARVTSRKVYAPSSDAGGTPA